MKTTRRLEIEIETERVTIRHCTVGRQLFPCPFCHAEVEVIAAEQAALLSGQAETGELHFIETAHGLLCICLPSLLEALASTVRRSSAPRAAEHKYRP